MILRNGILGSTPHAIPPPAHGTIYTYFKYRGIFTHDGTLHSLRFRKLVFLSAAKIEQSPCSPLPTHQAKGIIMNDWIEQLCSLDFMPHGQCYLWSPELIALHGISDSLIALSYLSIPLALFYFVRKRRDIPYPGIILMFALFIISCGVTHALEVWTIWHSNYYLTGTVKALTAVVSLATVVALVRIMPHALQLTGPNELRRLNETLEQRVQERTVALENGNAQLRREIAERERADAEVTRLNSMLQLRVDELQALFNVLPVGVGIAGDAECKSIRMNKDLADILGLDPQANASLSAPENEAPHNFKVTKDGRELMPDELPMQICARENRPVLGFEETVCQHDGSKVELLCNVVPLRDATGNAIGCVGTFQSVTALKKAQAGSARYAAIVASSEDAIIGIDLQRKITDWNHAAQKMFGYDEHEMIGRDAGIIIPRDRLKTELTLLEQIAAGAHPSPIESIGVTKEGETVDLSIMISPILDEAGQIVGFSKTARDISERRAAERRNEQLEIKIQETQKLESLGVLAGGIAHDFNNLLTGIVGNATLASLNLPENSQVGPYLEQIENASMRAAELCNQMLAYSGRGQFSLNKLDLNQLVLDTTQLLTLSISKTALLRQNLAAHLPAVEGDPAQLRQIIMNLVINASEAIGDRSGVIAITSGVVRVDEDYLQTLRHQGDIKTGDHVFLEVSDSGSGMDAQTLGRVFEPFFTTKFTGRGLGLAAVLGIVRGHHGALKVYSEPERGTTFKLLLPVCAGNPDTTKPDQTPVVFPKVQGTVMVVDDEETVRTVAAHILEDMGYTVELAENGRVAVEKFKADPARYRLVLLDLTMPYLNGEETFRQLRYLRPGIAVILMSGYSEQEAVSGFTGKGLAGFVQKPFNARVFKTAIHNFMLKH